MKSITAQLIPGKNPEHQAMQIAVDNGWNPYSKPYGDPMLKDWKSDREAVFNYRQSGQHLEVIIRLTDADPMEEPGTPAMGIVNNQTELFTNQ